MYKSSQPNTGTQSEEINKVNIIFRAYYQEYFEIELGKDDITFSKEALVTFSLTMVVSKGRVWHARVSS